MQILEDIDWSIWYFQSECTITEGHVTRNQPISFKYLYLTYNSGDYSTADGCHTYKIVIMYKMRFVWSVSV